MKKRNQLHIPYYLLPVLSRTYDTLCGCYDCGRLQSYRHYFKRA